MSRYSNTFLTLAAIGSLSLGGCATKHFDTNPSASIRPNIVSESIAQVEIKDQITGSACVNDFPFKRIFDLFGSEETFLETYVKHDRSKAAYAKAAAAYNALTAGRGLSTDIIVQPVWEVSIKHQVFVTDTCATVVGYRGVIKGFKEAVAKEEGIVLGRSILSSASPVAGGAIAEQAIAPPHPVTRDTDRTVTMAGQRADLDGCSKEKSEYARRFNIPCSALRKE